MNAPILEAEEIRGGYDGHEVLRGLSLQLKHGDFVGIVGPNGSGKSTLIKALTGLLLLQGGEVRLGGRPLRAYAPRDLARVLAVVPQMIAPSFAFTVREVVEMGRYPHLARFAAPGGDDHRVVEEAMALTDVTHLQHRPVDQLSGGELQRVTIARALAQQPQVMLLDEPTAHLDLGHQMQVLQLLERLNREQSLTVLCISHDLNLAAEYCHRLLLMSVGRIYAEGSPTEVLTVEHLRAVYGALVHVEANPYSGQPMVLLNRVGGEEEAE
jgi:iron complex transport system ATP-binding protein